MILGELSVDVYLHHWMQQEQLLFLVGLIG